MGCLSTPTATTLLGHSRGDGQWLLLIPKVIQWIAFLFLILHLVLLFLVYIL